MIKYTLMFGVFYDITRTIMDNYSSRLEFVCGDE